MTIFKKEKTRELLIGIVAFLIVNACFYFYVICNYNLIYGINDDWTLYMVISGSYLGYPEPRVNYMMFPLAWFIGRLYGITSSIPWYGLMLQGLVFSCGACVYFRIYNMMRGKWRKLLFSVIGLSVFLCAHMNVIVLIQFTQVGTICGATAVFLFLTADTKGKSCKEYLSSNIPTIIMATFSLNVRENTLYMCLPVAGMMLIVKWFIEDRKINKDVLLRYSGVVAAVLVFLGGTILCHKIAYSSPEWKEYVNVNNIWTRGVDYYGFPSADEIEDILLQNGMTKEDYEVSITYQTFYRGDMKYSDFLQVITDIGKENYDKHHTFAVKLKDANTRIVNCLSMESLRPMNYITCLTFVCVLILIGNSRNIMALFAFLCYLFGRFFAWYFLLFAGRFPDRIPQGLFSIELMTLMGVVLYFELWKPVGILKHTVVRASGIVILALVMLTIVKHGFDTQDELTAHVDTYQDRWYGIKEYCQRHPENRYFLSGGSQTLLYYSDNIEETDTIGKPQNFFTNTNFDSPSPNFYNMMGAEYESYLGDDMIEQEQNYWIYEKECFSENAPIVKFYQYEYENFSYELVDSFETETTSYEVYHFSK